MPNKITCATFIIHDGSVGKEVLLVQPTEKPFWEPPKGIKDVGENINDAAMREVFEETGIQLQHDALIHLGRYPYLVGKDIAFFMACGYNELLRAQERVCRSYFYKFGEGFIPEIQNSAWFQLSQVKHLVTANMLKAMKLMAESVKHQNEKISKYTESLVS